MIDQPPMTDEERAARTELLKAKLAASLGQPGYADRVKAIEAELERLNG